MPEGSGEGVPLDVITSGDLAAVRDAINIEDTYELEDDKLYRAWSDAQNIVDARNYKNRTGDLLQTAYIRYAAYLAYLAYSDHVVHNLPGHVDETTGDFVPIQPARDRDSRAKLDELRRAAEAAISALNKEDPRPPLRIQYAKVIQFRGY